MRTAEAMPAKMPTPVIGSPGAIAQPVLMDAVHVLPVQLALVETVTFGKYCLMASTQLSTLLTFTYCPSQKSAPDGDVHCA